jgi:hypothetical protein
MDVGAQPAPAEAGDSDDGGSTPPPLVGVPDAGRITLLLMGSRVSFLYQLGILVAVLLSVPPGGPDPAWLAAAVLLTVCGIGISGGVARPLAAVPAGVLAVSVLVAMATLVRVQPGLSPHDAQILVGVVVSSAAAGAALSWGPWPGLAVTGYALACWAGPVRALHPSMDDSLFLGGLAGGLFGATGSYLLRRGYTVTQRALAAAEEAVTARAVAAAHWRARRGEIRTLHDTVLSTLSLLAQGGEGVDPVALRADCGAQAQVLREADLARTDRDQPDPVEVATTGCPGAAGPFEVLRRRWADRSLEVRLYGPPDVLDLDDVAPPAAAALVGAVEECLENVRRHAGVSVASVVVLRAAGEVRCMVTDEGVGFQAWDQASYRIGLGDSVGGRIREVGGSVRVWSAPGSGTSVALSVPAGGPDGGALASAEAGGQG